MRYLHRGDVKRDHLAYEGIDGKAILKLRV
jgi:hypothetical protein